MHAPNDSRWRRGHSPRFCYTRLVPGIVSLLSEQHDHCVRRLWEALEREFACPPQPEGAIPHMSYHVATAYDWAGLEPVLAGIAASEPPAQTETHGLGIFNGEPAVLYLAVTRSPALTRLHAHVTAAADRFAGGQQDYFHERRWAPHITLAITSLDAGAAAEAVIWLHRQPLAWEFAADNLAVMDDGGGRHSLLARYPFAAAR
ncbi:hypothetical protein AYO38_03020 [bacterium SCGC AG-212-C10]|nr:hypothetical protein AYO38_03020 [bacterium SCGC AG-212-C10]